MRDILALQEPHTQKLDPNTYRRVHPYDRISPMAAIRNFPALSRRRLLQTAMAGAALSAAPVSSLMAHGGRTDTDFWKAIRGQFALKPGLVPVNAANLCPAPYPVMAKVMATTRNIDRDPSSQNRARFAEARAGAREALARYIGARPEEVAIVRNTSEGNNTIVSGLPLGAGDEVVIWDQNHATNNVAWEVHAKRRGFDLVKVSTPPDPQSAEDLIAPFTEAISPRTRVLGLTHLSNLTGVMLPISDLCAMAAERNIRTLVDGAQTFGAVKLEMEQLGCDFYTASSHKWFMGPREAGILFVRSKLIDEVWPLSVGIGWDRALEHGAQKFETLGQRNDATLAALEPTVDFHESIGRSRVEGRVRELASHLVEELGKIAGLRLHTPSNPSLRAGVVVFAVEQADPPEIAARLYREHGVACAAMPGTFAGVRFSPQVYNTAQDIDHVLRSLTSVLKT